MLISNVNEKREWKKWSKYSLVVVVDGPWTLRRWLRDERTNIVYRRIINDFLLIITKFSVFHLTFFGFFYWSWYLCNSFIFFTFNGWFVWIWTLSNLLSFFSRVVGVINHKYHRSWWSGFNINFVLRWCLLPWN